MSRRIGLLVPSSNTTVEVEFYRTLPASVTLHVARFFAARGDADSSAASIAELEHQSRNLASAGVDVVVLGAAWPRLHTRAGCDRELIARMESAAGTRATTASIALVEALQFLGVGRVVLGAHHDNEDNAAAAAVLAARGIEVVAAGRVENGTVGRPENASAYELARAIDRADAEAIVLAGTHWKTLDVIEHLERELGKPVVSTTQASLWAALRIVGGVEGVRGCGRLLRDLLAPSRDTQLA